AVDVVGNAVAVAVGAPPIEEREHDPNLTPRDRRHTRRALGDTLPGRDATAEKSALAGEPIVENHDVAAERSGRSRGDRAGLGNQPLRERDPVRMEQAE